MRSAVSNPWSNVGKISARFASGPLANLLPKMRRTRPAVYIVHIIIGQAQYYGAPDNLTTCVLSYLLIIFLSILTLTMTLEHTFHLKKFILLLIEGALE